MSGVADAACRDDRGMSPPAGPRLAAALTPPTAAASRRSGTARRRPLVAAFVTAVIAALPAGAPGSAAAAAAGEAGDPRPSIAAGAVVAGDARPRDGWTWPVPPPVRVIAPFLAPPTPYAAGHRGIDIAAGEGDGVVAPAGGVVTFAGQVAGRGVIAIDHGDGIVSAIEPVAAAVRAGDEVGAGAPVGVVATGGHCDGACVHFGVRLHGAYVSPLLFLGGVPRAVLLPLR